MGPSTEPKRRYHRGARARRLRLGVVGLVAGLLLAAAGLLPVVADPARAEDEGTAFTFVAIGDMPYFVPRDYERFAALAELINALAPAFTVHVGDIKRGSTPCTDEAMGKVAELFGGFAHPLIFTPGDNEWTDCHRKSAGSYDPLERLARLREFFFADDHSLGGAPRRLERQSRNPAYRLYVENARWEENGVVFTTLHVVGSNDNLGRTPRGDAEHFARLEANLAWLEEAFGRARAIGAPALVLFFHADPHFEQGPSGEIAFNRLLAALAENAVDFHKPVLVVHGDGHVYRRDQPLRSEDGRAIENVTRLEVFGATSSRAVLVRVDPGTASVFAFEILLLEPDIMPGRTENRAPEPRP